MRLNYDRRRKLVLSPFLLCGVGIKDFSPAYNGRKPGDEEVLARCLVRIGRYVTMNQTVRFGKSEPLLGEIRAFVSEKVIVSHEKRPHELRIRNSAIDRNERLFD